MINEQSYINKGFEEFVKEISFQLKKVLPGFSAQKLMSPIGRKPSCEYLKDAIIPKKSAVLILLYPDSHYPVIKTVLILRPDNEAGNHTGQISFPGGGFDESDINLSETALREAEEEVGIKRNAVTLIGELTPLYIPVSNYMVHPYVGFIRTVPDFKINPVEVSTLLEVEIENFISDKNIKTCEVFVKIHNKTIEVPCYNVNNKIIWGATAMIISEISEIIKRMNFSKLTMPSSGG